MSHRTLTTATALGALVLVGEGALELLHPQGDPFTGFTDHLIELLFAAGLALTLTGLLALHRRRPPGAGALADAGLRAAAAGQGVLALLALASAARGHDVGGPFFPLALLALTGGLVAGAVGLARAGERRALVLPVALVGAFAAGPGGLALLGAAWLVVLAGDRGALAALRARPAAPAGAASAAVTLRR
jgi:hypothetical protein